MSERYTLCVFSENSPGVLHRITTLFTRRKLNIESLTVSETEKSGISRFTIVVQTERELAYKVADQIQRIIEVSDVYVCDDSDLVFKEIALYKVSASEDEQRRRLDDLVLQQRAQIAFAKNGYVIIEKMGTEVEVRSLYALLEPFGMLEFVRSGRIGLLKENREEKQFVEHEGGDNEEAKAFI